MLAPREAIELRHGGPAVAPARLSRRRKIGFGVLALHLSLGLALGLGELLVRLTSPQDLSGTWREYSSGGYLMNKASGTARHQSGKRLVHYRFNDQHLRAAPLAAESAKTTRVLALGDSFTFGWLLDEPDSYVGQLQARADAALGPGKVELLNGAAGGWGTEEYTAFLEDYGASIRPHVVLVFIGVDDTERAKQGQLFRLSDPSQLELRRTGQRAPESRLKRLANAFPGYQFLLEHSHLLQLLRQFSLRAQLGAWNAADRPQAPAVIPSVAPDDPAVLKENALLLRIAAWCRKHGTTLLVVTNWPVDAKYTPVLPERNQHNLAFRAQAAQFLGARGIPFFDAGPAIGTQIGDDLDTYVIKNDSHPTETGAKAIAEAIWPWLEPRLREAVAAR